MRRVAGTAIAAMCVAASLQACAGDAASPPFWQRVPEGEDHGWLLSVWGPGPDVRFAVGGEPEAGTVLRSEGDHWEPMRLPADVPLLNWVYGFGAEDVFAVGNDGTALRFDGEAWRQEPTPTDEDLWGVWGSRPDALWAVGGSGRAGSEATLLRRDGSGWQRVALPELERPNVRALFKVWGSGPDDVYAVGQRGVVLHWDGSRWQELHVGADDDLIALWGTGPDQIVAVGGRGQAVVSRWDGKAWDTRKIARTPGLNGIWMQNDGTAYLVGESGTALRLPAGSFEAQDHSVPTPLTLHAVFGGMGARLTAVGGNLAASSGPFEGVLLEHRTGEAE